MPVSNHQGVTWITGRQVDASELAMLDRWEKFHGLEPTFVLKNPPPPQHTPPGFQQVAEASERFFLSSASLGFLTLGAGCVEAASIPAAQPCAGTKIPRT